MLFTPKNLGEFTLTGGSTLNLKRLGARFLVEHEDDGEICKKIIGLTIPDSSVRSPTWFRGFVGIPVDNFSTLWPIFMKNKGTFFSSASDALDSLAFVPSTDEHTNLFCTGVLERAKRVREARAAAAADETR